MKRLLPIVCALALALPVMGQESEKTTVTTKETKVAPEKADFDLLGELWSMQDATPLPPGQVDLRFTTQWITANAPANRGDSNDDFIFTPSLVWGAVEGVEAFLNVPIWMGDSGNIPGQEDGQADTYAGFLWRFLEQEDSGSDWAVQASGRFPTGCNSNGIDGELRLIISNEYDSGIRSHLNGFVYTSNGDNVENNRHFQWGAVVGLDGDLNEDGTVRWVLDYINRSSTEYGHDNINLVDVGWQWKLADSQNLGMSFQVGVDHGNDEAPNFGATMTYSWSLTY